MLALVPLQEEVHHSAEPIGAHPGGRSTQRRSGGAAEAAERPSGGAAERRSGEKIICRQTAADTERKLSFA
jgi:hypothetical protein